MIALVEMIFGSKVGRIIAEILLGIALAGLAVVYLEHRGAARELATLQKSSAQLLAKAQKDIQAETAQHAADVKSNEEKTNAALAANVALNAQLDDRLRAFNTYRSQHPNVPRPPSGSGPAPSGECGVISCGELASRALQDGNDLARSNGELSASLQSCQRDRDSLNGLPK